MVYLEKLTADDEIVVKNLLRKHNKYTGSKYAKSVIDNLQNEIKKFVKVMPIEYKRVLEGVEIEERLDLSEVSDG